MLQQLLETYHKLSQAIIAVKEAYCDNETCYGMQTN